MVAAVVTSVGAVSLRAGSPFSGHMRFPSSGSVRLPVRLPRAQSQVVVLSSVVTVTRVQGPAWNTPVTRSLQGTPIPPLSD